MNSQAKQDEFVLTVLRNKRGGYWLELGGNDPIVISNTHGLEKEFDWSGTTIEMDSKYLALYQQRRPKMMPVIIDATMINYRKLSEQFKFPKVIDYLQIDLEPLNRSPLTALELIEKYLMEEHIFSTVTFEHDVYRSNVHKVKKRAFDIFCRNDYVKLFDNVLCDNKHPFEDWYVHVSTLPFKTVKNIMEDEDNHCNIEPETCIKILKKYIKA